MTNNYQMKMLYHFCEKIAPTDSTVLIQGESGTGKSLLANHIHQISHRSHEKMYTINCATLPDELIDAELFGYEKGAFSGALDSGNEGLFKAAHKGTIFLDEIDELDVSSQAKLLQVIQDRTIRRLGSNEFERVDVRIIAATNEHLPELIKQNLFREDLYYRLNVIDLHLPTLRERSEDIVPLIYMFLNKYNTKYNTDKIITEDAINILKAYSWPGNIRQLENIINRLVIMGGKVIEVFDLPEIIQKEGQGSYVVEGEKGLNYSIESLTSLIIRQSYRIHKTSRKIAEDLRISQSRAARLIRKYCK